MSLVKKYYFFKRMLQVLLGLNVLLIAWGFVAALNYFKTHDVAALELAGVATATLLVGILLPLYFIYKIEKQIIDLRHKTEKMVASWVALWLENSQDFENEAYRDPIFWMNVVLLSVESASEYYEHPVLDIFAEFSPILRQEMTKRSPYKRSRVKRAS